jgi:hypothetical protein
MSEHPRLQLRSVDFFERQVAFRRPFRFGIVTLTAAPQVFVRAEIALDNGAAGAGMSSELLVPKWFDKSPDLSNEQNFDQLRRALAIASETYRAAAEPLTAFGLHAAAAEDHTARCRTAGLPMLVANFGTALLDRAILDAVLRLTSTSVFAGVRGNIMGLDARTAPDLAGMDLGAFLAKLEPQPSIHVRHTVGLLDPIESRPGQRASGDDERPDALEDIVAADGVRYFKVKVSGQPAADLERLQRIAGILDHLPGYHVTLDGNEQYRSGDEILAFWRTIGETPALARFRDAILFVEQPIARDHAFATDIGPLAAFVPVEIDESDATLEAFLAARRHGYTGVSSKSCKGFYRSLLNQARCVKWNAEAGRPRYFMSAEDLTTQAGIGVQQDLALATLIGCTHVERNGHHYVDGMAAAPPEEQALFLCAHADLYERPAGTVRVKIRDGRLAIGSLNTPGLASAVLPDLQS